MGGDSRILDLRRPGSGTNSVVDAMLAELEGTAPSPRGASSGRTVWTWQFAASGKELAVTAEHQG
jgi:hypothetical protein